MFNSSALFATVIATGSIAGCLLFPAPTLAAPAVAQPLVAQDDQEPTPYAQCVEACLAQLTEDRDDILDEAGECLENAAAGARIAHQLCLLIEDPDQARACTDVVAAAFEDARDACGDTAAAELAAALEDYDACVEDCGEQHG